MAVGSSTSPVATSTSTVSAAFASTTDESTLVIPALEDVTPVEENFATSTDPLVQQDAIEPVIIEPLLDTSTSTRTDHIEDVIVAPLVEEFSTTTDSQGGVATTT